MQKILTKREKVVFYLTAGVIIFSLIFNLLIVPLWKKNETLNREIKSTQMKLRKYAWLLKNKDRLTDKYSKLVSGRISPDKAKDDLVNTLTELETLAKESGVRILDIRPSGLSVDLRLEGDMPGYLRFIYRLENSLLLLRIKKFQLNSRPNTTNLEGLFSISPLTK